jgi:hypothetical protein
MAFFLRWHDMSRCIAILLVALWYASILQAWFESEKKSFFELISTFSLFRCSVPLSWSLSKSM